MSTVNNISTFAIPLASLLLEVFGYAFRAIIAAVTEDRKRSYILSSFGLIVAWLIACGVTIPISIIFLLSDTDQQSKVINVIVIVIQSGLNLSAALATAQRGYNEANEGTNNRPKDTNSAAEAESLLIRP